MSVYVVVLTETVAGVGDAGDFLQCRWREVVGEAGVRMLWWGKQKKNTLRVGTNATSAISIMSRYWPGVPYRFEPAL